MLYVIKVVQEFEDDDFRYTIKIGYTKDWGRRKIQYESYFNRVHVLFLYKEGTMKDESQVLGYFKDYKVFKNEWFEYNPSIIDFFKNNDTIDKIRESTKAIIVYKKNRYFTNINVFLLNYILDSFGDLDLIEKAKRQKEIENELGYYDPKNHIDLACQLYNLNREIVESYIDDMTTKTLKASKSVIKFAEEFNLLNSVDIKLEKLVEFSKSDRITDLDMNNLFQLIPEKYGDYYTVLGPKRIAACSYQESTIKQEFNRLRDNANIFDDLSEEIYKLFQVGERYSKSDIKKTISKLYEKLGYQKTAKATDLGEFFVIKSVMTKDRSAGFEIIAKK